MCNSIITVSGVPKLVRDSFFLSWMALDTLIKFPFYSILPMSTTLLKWVIHASVRVPDEKKGLP